jgi:hypothetical protein
MNISQKVLKFYNSLEGFENHRYRSWEHCYNYFKKISNKDKISSEEEDLAQLHLAFYLASWGMYRGSSFILQKDYTIFKSIINIILNKEYSILWKLEDNLNKREELIKKFSELYEKIEAELKTIKKSIKHHPDLKDTRKRYLQENSISYTLVTKILLGTVGCIPAYDRFFIEGVGKEKEIKKRFDAWKSFSELIDFYIENKKEIDSITIKCTGYNPMKIIDMYFWEIGYEKELDEKNV